MKKNFQQMNLNPKQEISIPKSWLWYHGLGWQIWVNSSNGTANNYLNRSKTEDDHPEVIAQPNVYAGRGQRIVG